MGYTFIHRMGTGLQNLPLSPDIEFFAIFKNLILEYFDTGNTYRHFIVGKMLSTQLRQHDAKIQITYAEQYRQSVNLFTNKYF